MIRDSFTKYHPIINFLYFTIVIGMSMFLMHPILQILGITIAFSYSVILLGKKAVKNLFFLIPIMIFVAVINPLFTHEGITILCYFKNGNPITLESILFGLSSSIMIVTVIIWFSCYNVIMISDKFIYLFGNIIPSLSLIFSMVLRFVPRYRIQIKKIINAQKSIGNDIKKGNIIQRIKYGIKILSIMTSWALENQIETADSMKSRGYGLKKRTAFSIYYFNSRDKIIFIIMIFLAIILVITGCKGYLFFTYYPRIKYKVIDSMSIITFITYTLFLMIPITINIYEEIKWKYYAQKI